MTTLRVDAGWEEGHQLLILLYERSGKLGELLSFYESQGEQGKRWAEVVRLVVRFQGEKARYQDPSLPDRLRNWWMRFSFLGIGLTVTFFGSLWFKKSVETNSALFGPVFSTVFGLTIAAGSALLNWKIKKKKTDDHEAPDVP